MFNSHEIASNSRKIIPEAKQGILALYLIVSGVQMAAYYVGKVVVQGDLYFDAEAFWLPIARRLANGEILYVTVHDNKPPLFYYLNQLVYASGYYAELFYAVIALANAAVAYLLFRWLERHGQFSAGVIAGGLYLAAMPLVNGTFINVRSLSMVFVMLAVLTTRPGHRGVYLAAGTLISQYTVFAIPVLLWDGLARTDRGWRWGGVYIVAGLLTAAFLYLPLFLAWGEPAVVGGVREAFLSSGDYIVGHADQYNPYLHPFSWLENLAMKALELGFVLVPAAAAVAASYVGVVERRQPFALAALLGGSFLVTLGIRSLFYYWIPVVAFCSVVAAIGVDQFSSDGGDGTS